MSYGNTYGTGCLDLTGFTCEPCAPIEHGRIRGVALISKDFTFMDPTDDTEWLAGIAANQIVVIPKTNGQFDGGTETYGEGFGNDDKEYETSEFKGMFTDFNYEANAVAYNKARKAAYKDYKLAFCSENFVHITDSPVTLQPKAVIKNDKKARVVWEVAFSFIQEDHPLPYLKPSGIFVCD
jgi:hypothetical protein